MLLLLFVGVGWGKADPDDYNRRTVRITDDGEDYDDFLVRDLKPKTFENVLLKNKKTLVTIRYKNSKTGGVGRMLWA